MIYCEKSKMWFNDEEFFNEVWKDIPGWEGLYKASNLGRIYGEPKYCGAKNKQKRKIRGRILSESNSGWDYLTVCLRFNGKKEQNQAHVFIWKAFFGDIEEGKEICHIDGNGKNNRISNLRLGTPTENQKDRIKHGTYQYGEKNPSSKLKVFDVISMRNKYKEGKDKYFLADLYKIHPSHVMLIVKEKSWSWLH
jgi:hypothetical protein